MSINVGKAIGYLDLDTSGFKRGFTSALQDLRIFQDRTASVSSKAKALGSAFTNVGSVMTKYVTTPIVGVGTAAVATAAKFESAMSEVAAISGASGKDLEALTEKAKQMGATTKFSASESAAALKYMAMAGWDTKAMLDGIDGVMQLAAASGEDLAQTSDIVTDAMTAFGMSADQANRFADVLAQTANRSNTSVALMGETFKYVAPVAGALGYSIEDTSVAIGLMANSGIKASIAGTSLKNLLTNLAKPTKQVAGYMDALGISLTDSSGEMKPLSQLLVELRESFSGLTKAQKAEYAAGIAGKEGMSGLLAIVTASQSDFDKLTEAINNSNGAAKDVANVMLDNLGGQLTILKSTLEGIAIAFGDILLPTIKSVVSGLQSFLDWVTNLTDGQKQLVVTIAAIVAAIGPVLLIVGKLITSVVQIAKVVTSVVGVIAKIGPAVAGVVKAVVSALGPVGMIITIIGAVIAALVALYNKNETFRNFVNNAWAQIKEVIGGVVNAIVNFFTVTIPGAIDAVASWFQSLADSVVNFFTVSVPNAINAGLTWIQNFANSVANFFTVTIPAAISALIQWFVQLPERIGYAIGYAVGTVARWVVDMADTVSEVGPKVIDAVVNFFKSLPGKIWNFLVEVIAKVGLWVAQTKEKAVTIRDQVIETVVNFFKALPGRVWNFLLEVVAKVGQWVAQTKAKAQTVGSQVIDTVVNFFKQLPGKIWTALSSALEKVKNWGSSVINWAKTTIPKIVGKIVDGFKALPGKMVTVGKQLLEGLKEGILNALSGLLGKIKSVGNSIVKGFKDAFGIKSPSRKTMEMGKMLMAGLAKGLGGSLGLVEKQIQTVSMAITDTFEKALPTARTLTIGTDSLIGGYSNKTPQLAGATSSSYAVPVSNTYVFNSPEAVTPTVAAKLMKQTAQQMAMNIR
nr:MAG TPA: minor tail protein [Caudoviricetes sp.]